MARAKKTKARKAPKVKRKQATKRRNVVAGPAQLQPPAPVLGYEQTLLNNIISNAKPSGATEYSIILNSVLSTLTPGMRAVYYNNGLSLGRSLYNLYHARMHYIIPDECVSDIVSFLENAGYANTTYHIFPDRTDIKFNGRDSTLLGASMHVFESGLIAGFISASTQQHVRVEEIACSNNGARQCHFVTLAAPLPIQTPGRDTMNMFIESAKAIAGMQGKPADHGFSEEYLMLASSLITNQEYSVHIARVMHHIGREIGNELKNPARLKRLERLFDTLGLGKLKVGSAARLSIELRLDRLKAKKGFVDISNAFLNGLLDSPLSRGSRLAVKGAKNGNSYVIKVTVAK
ncbi:MAG: 4-vinyl reductase [Candidatus Micrarchaeaceae archaeon]